MGLDITAFEKVTPSDHIQTLRDDGVPEGWCDNEDHYVAFVYAGMEQSLRGLEAGRCYELGSSAMGFRAGSYSGYSEWRADLAQTMLGVRAQEVWSHPEEWIDKPFYELINFADNEGSIGPEAAADLAEDFRQGRDRYLAAHTDSTGEGGWYRQKYEDWLQAFELAANSGMVMFH